MSRVLSALNRNLNNCRTPPKSFPAWLKSDLPGQLIQIIALVLAWAATSYMAQAAISVNLAWDPNPEPDIAGYRLYYGSQSGVYSHSVDTGPSTEVTLASLAKGITYYIVVTAYNTAGYESLPSAEAVFEAPPNELPLVTFITPETGTGTEFNAPGSIALTASASDTDGRVTRVEFYVDSLRIAERTAPPFTALWNAKVAGDHSISAVAYDDDDGTALATATISAREFAVSSMRRTSNGSVELTISGAIGRTNQVLVSNDLKTWTPLQTALNSTGTLVISDPDAAHHSQRFYKVSSD
jgi:hypothetical protein